MSPQRWNRLDHLFHAALDCSPDEIDAFLRRECGEDSALYSEVRAMLEAHNRNGLLDQSPWPNGPGSQSNIPTESILRSQPVFTVGDVVSGRYRIVRFVNRGGMGEVYEAEDLELHERTALKTLLPSIADDTRMIARFKQEIQLSRKVGHPNVCRVFDLARHSVDASGPSTYFLTMEFLPGETLSARLQRERRLSLDVALPIIQQIADALDAAHRAGVIHRDLKPSNVMLVPEGAGLRAVVTDFGLARSVHTGEVTATRSSQLMGTFDYMAPELFGGRGASIASDIYALGMVACKMMTGELPSAADTIESAAPSASLGALAADLEPASHQAILRSIDPRPGVRFATAAAFVSALRGETAPSITVTITPAARFRIAAAIALLFLGAAVFLGWRSWTAFRSRPSPEAEAYFQKGVERIHSGAYFAATKALEEALKIWPDFAFAHARLAEAWNELLIPERAKTEMLAARRADPRTLSERERIQVDAIDFTITRDFAAAVSKYEQLRSVASAPVDIDLGRAYEKALRRPAAIAAYRRAAEGPQHSPSAWLRLAVLYSRDAKPQEAEEAFRQAEKLLDNNMEGLIELAFQRGIDAVRRRVFDQGAGFLLQARNTAHLAGNLQQEIAATLQLANTAYLNGDGAQAENYAKEALQTARANQMELLAVSGINNLGSAYVRKSDFVTAEKYFQEALALARQNGAHRQSALSLLLLASLHDQTRQYGSLVQEAGEALKFYEANGFVNETLQCLTLLGRYYQKQDNSALALDYFQRTAAIAEKANDRPRIADAEASLGSLFVTQERYPDALVHYRRGLDFSTSPEDKGYAALQCADTLSQLGRFDEAGEMFTRAEADAGNFPALRIKLARARASMLYRQGRIREAAAAVRVALANVPPQDVSTTAELWRILGLAMLGSGDKKEGLRYCEKALGAFTGLAGVSSLVNARLAVARARIAMGDFAGARALLDQVQPALASRPESRWQASALFARIDPTRNLAARQAFEELERQFGQPAFGTYRNRADLQELMR